jgi:hypothetical protein
MSNVDIVGILMAGIILVNLARLFPVKPADPAKEKIRQWKRNKKKWAKHKFDV